MDAICWSKYSQILQPKYIYGSPSAGRGKGPLFGHFLKKFSGSQDGQMLLKSSFSADLSYLGLLNVVDSMKTLLTLVESA